MPVSHFKFLGVFVNQFLNLTYCLTVLGCFYGPVRGSEMMMTLFVSKLQRRDAADRDALGKACRADRALEGVRSARFYWVSPDEVAVIVDAELGAYGPGSGAQATPEGAAAAFAVADLAQRISFESGVEAGQGEQTYRLAQEAASREPALAGG